MKSKLFLALLRSSIQCIWGTRSTVGDAETQANLLVVAESKFIHVALPLYFTFCNVGITVLILFSFLFISMRIFLFRVILLVYINASFIVLNRAYNRAGEGDVEGSVKSR